MGNDPVPVEGGCINGEGANPDGGVVKLVDGADTSPTNPEVEAYVPAGGWAYRSGPFCL